MNADLSLTDYDDSWFWTPSSYVFTTGEGQKVSWEIDLLRMRSKSFSEPARLIPLVSLVSSPPSFFAITLSFLFLESSPPLVSFFSLPPLVCLSLQTHYLY